MWNSRPWEPGSSSDSGSSFFLKISNSFRVRNGGFYKKECLPLYTSPVASPSLLLKTHQCLSLGFFFFFPRLDEWNQRFGQIQPYIFIFFRRLRAALNTGFWKLVSLHNYKPARQFTIAAQNATGLEWKAAQNLSVLFLDRSPGPWYRRALEPRQDRDLKNSSGFCGPFYMQYDLNQRV